jgi:hypothetical protein
MRILNIWTIFDHPHDHPNMVVARRFEVEQGNSEPVSTQDVRLGSSVEEVRRLLPPGLSRIPRDPGDSPGVVESWL